MFIVKECTKESSGTASGMNDRDGKRDRSETLPDRCGDREES
jgi:hypothetical protein